MLAEISKLRHTSCWFLKLAVCTIAITTNSLASERIQLESFAIDQTEVTAAEFAAYAEEYDVLTAAQREGGGYEWGAGWERRAGWDYQNPAGSPAKQNEPAVHISWAEAKAYCESVGGRLPTSEEWISAAFTEQRDAPTDGFTRDTRYEYPVGAQAEGMNNNREHHVPVGTTHRGVNGLYDMGGNVWEWLMDREGNQALTAGGSWWYGPEKTRAKGMQWKPFDFFALYVGFRCVY